MTADGPDVVRLRDQPERWPVHASAQVHVSGPFAVREDVVSLPGREERFRRLVVVHPGAVVVLAVDDEERALVLRQYRHAVGMRLLELPAGLLDQPGEDPLEAARRELLEEGAHEAAEWTRLGAIHTSPGISSERIDLYLARRLTPVPDRGGFELEHEEADMTMHWVPVVELLEAIAGDRLTNGPLVTAVLRYALHSGRAPLPSGR